jgi:hypothetical protein
MRPEEKPEEKRTYSTKIAQRVLKRILPDTGCVLDVMVVLVIAVGLGWISVLYVDIVRINISINKK